MINDIHKTLWMTIFLRCPDQDKQKCIAEVVQSNDIKIMDSIRFHLSMRNQLHLLRSEPS
ncbi:hypothetical protein [Paenibacillus glacialis]|uniref:Uncharacterized protein n=1 Tax=Paenibacillus glacialis TaxID=494026 RepID=A0A168K7X2_9BACL|nr:hypothetical protein [Paenibacillus glacialis]OAB41672.1 hypothetical protein PGLA_15455 [Paenibacillus glacialis]